MWYDNKGKEEDIIIFSKISAARNVNGFAFPGKMSRAERDVMLDNASEAASDLGLRFIRTEELSKTQKLDFILHNIIGTDFLEDSDGTGLLISDDESQSIIVNKVNHFHIQGLTRGCDITDIFLKTTKLAVDVERKFDIAYSERLGFLTSKPSEVGTGVRISMCIAIPGIFKSNTLPQLLKRLQSLDWSISPYVVEPNKKGSCLYMIYNTATLGLVEDKLYERAKMIASDIVRLERKCRATIYQKHKITVEDQYCRSYGIIKYCRSMEPNEAYEILNWLRFGYDLIEDVDIKVPIEKINKITEQLCLENHINPKIQANEKMNIARADEIRNTMEGDDTK